MIIANIDTESTYTNVRELWQYDYGQILRIQNMNLPPCVEVHFSLTEKDGESIPRIGVTKDGVTDVTIPDSILENGDTTSNYNIYVFVYLTDENSGKTVHRITLLVKSRPKTPTFEKTEDTELFREAIKQVNESAELAKESTKEAESWAHGHDEYPDRDEDNAKYYAKKAKDEAETILEDAKNVQKEINDTVNSFDSDTAKALEDLSNAKNESIKAIESAGNEQKSTVTEEGEKQIKAIQTLKEDIDTVANSISEDKKSVENTKDAVDKLKTQIDTNSEKALQDIGTAKDDAVKEVQATIGAIGLYIDEDGDLCQKEEE